MSATPSGLPTETSEPVAADDSYFRSLIENTPDIITILEPNGTIRYESPAIQQQLGYAPDEIVGRNAFEFLHPDDCARVELLFHECLLQTGMIRYGEFRFRHKDGSWRVFEGVGKNLLNDPAVRGVIVTSRDITERKRIDAELRETQRQQRALLDNIPDVAWIKDKDSRFIAVNEAFAKAFRCRPEEMVGKTDFDIVPCEIAERYIADDRQIMETRVTRRIEEPFVDATGNYIWVETLKSPVTNREDEVIGTTGIARDISDRKRVGEALRLSEARYRGLFDSMLEGFALCEIICDADGKPCDYLFLDVNASFERILGIPRAEAIGRNIRDIYPGIEPSWIESYGKVALTGEPASFENCLKAIDKYFRVAAFSPQRGQFAAIFSDVTEPKRAEERLRLQSSALEAAANGIVITDRQGNILWVNAAFTKLTGYTAAEAVGQNTRLLKSDKQSAEFYRNLWQTVSSGVVWHGDLVNRRKDGTLYSEEMTITPLRDDEGAVTHFIAIKQDVSHRKQTETALRESEELFRSLSASSPLGIFLTDTRGNLTYANPRCRALYGFSLIEGQNDGWLNFLHADDRAWVTARWQTFINEGTEYSCEYRIQRRDGTVCHVHTRGAPLRHDDGSPMGFVGSVEDITERKLTDLALQQTNTRLEQALSDLKAAQSQVVQQERLRALGTMASGIAHDFNNALASVLGFSELLIHRPENLADRDKSLRFLQMINTAAQDAGNVVNRLREFYRHREEGEVFVAIELNHLVEEAVSLTQPKWKNQAEANGVTIVVVTKPSEVPPVSGNPADLREALTNLIFNAVDAMPEGGSITLRTRRDNSHVVLEIADTGTGMTEEVRRRCLEPFFTTKGERGTGLGLSMVYGIVQRHEGTIDIQSAPGQGTTFILKFPALTQAPPAPVATAEENTLRPLRVLLMDDEMIVRKILEEFLKGDGHTITTATDGHDGLSKFGAGQFDVVILDRAMPGLSGDQVAATIKQRSPQMPVLLLTGFGNMMLASGEKPPGVDLILGKPVTMASLRAALASIVPA